MANVYLLINSSDAEQSYDYFDSCVVIAENEQDARMISPMMTDENLRDSEESDRYIFWFKDAPSDIYDWWCYPNEVEVKLIGRNSTLEPGYCVLSSWISAM